MSDLRERVLGVLAEIAPEIETDEVGDDTDLREEMELDSMDFLNFAIAVHERFGIEIPESDYPLLATIAGCVSYLEEKGAAQS